MLHDLRYAMRILRRNPTFAVVAILALSLGTGANAAIFQLVNALRLRSLPVEKPHELVSIGIDRHGTGRVGRGYGGRSIFTEPLWQEIRSQQQAFSSLFACGISRAEEKPFLRMGSTSAEGSSPPLACTLRSVACSRSKTTRKDAARLAWCCRTGSGRPGSEANRG